MSRDKNPVLLLDLIESFGYKVAVDAPTRITARSSTCIDNFLLSSDVEIFDTLICDMNLSDHTMQILTLSVNNIASSTNPKLIRRRNFCEENILAFKNVLNQENWNTIYSYQCPNEAFNFLVT